MNTHTRRRRAFVAILAIMMMGLVGVALLAVANRFATDARQARAEREGAQAEQLLLAGLEIARQSKPAGKATIKLPTALADESVSLIITRQGDKTTVEARVGTTVLREPVDRARD